MVEHTETTRAIRRSKKQVYRDAYQWEPMERIEIIRKGISAAAIEDVCRQMDLPLEAVCRYLNLSLSAVKRKISLKALLTPDQSERALGLFMLLGKVEVLVEECGNARKFDVSKWFGHWLAAPCPALGGCCPGNLMDTIAGQKIVSSLLNRMRSAAYS